MNQTFLHENHINRGAKMIPFGGYTLPAWFSSLKEEHNAVRENVGCFDISHMGVCRFSGPGVAEFIQRIQCNDMEKSRGGKMVYSMILNHEAGILDDVMFGELGEDFIMVVNASNREKLFAWFDEIGLGEIQLENLSADHGFIAVQGPNAVATVDEAFATSFSETGRFTVFNTQLNGVDVIVMRTGYTGEDGFEVIVHKDEIDGVWDALIDAGIQPCGLGARDSLRMEVGLPLYSQELSEQIHPYMTRYKWVVKFDTDFIGKDALLVLKEKDAEWATVGIEMIEKGIPRTGYPIKEGGQVTSGTLSPSSGKALGMAMVKPEFAAEGTELHVEIRSKPTKAKVFKF